MGFQLRMVKMNMHFLFFGRGGGGGGGGGVGLESCGRIIMMAVFNSPEKMTCQYKYTREMLLFC